MIHQREWPYFLTEYSTAVVFDNVIIDGILIENVRKKKPARQTSLNDSLQRPRFNLSLEPAIRQSGVGYKENYYG